jgi:hypothetical protein
MREMTEASAPPTLATPLAAALECVERWHWDVCLGSAALRVDAGWACSCRSRACPGPGTHPLHPDWHKKLTSAPSRVHEWWSQHPDASIVLPTGRAFDAIDVSEQAGCLALARLERIDAPIGPVLATPARRMQFLVLPGARNKVASLLPRLGWSGSSLDLGCHGEHGYVLAPPSRNAVRGRVGHVQWMRDPAEANPWLPDVEELLPTLAYACGSEPRPVPAPAPTPLIRVPAQPRRAR